MKFTQVYASEGRKKIVLYIQDNHKIKNEIKRIILTIIKL